nr:hypothetical protein [Tanacetum cinerariifolium]
MCIGFQMHYLFRLQPNDTYGDGTTTASQLSWRRGSVKAIASISAGDGDINGIMIVNAINKVRSYGLSLGKGSRVVVRIHDFATTKDVDALLHQAFAYATYAQCITSNCGYMAPSPEGVASPHNQVGSSPEVQKMDNETCFDFRDHFSIVCLSGEQVCTTDSLEEQVHRKNRSDAFMKAIAMAGQNLNLDTDEVVVLILSYRT